MSRMSTASVVSRAFEVFRTDATAPPPLTLRGANAVDSYNQPTPFNAAEDEPTEGFGAGARDAVSRPRASAIDGRPGIPAAYRLRRWLLKNCHMTLVVSTSLFVQVWPRPSMRIMRTSVPFPHPS